MELHRTPLIEDETLLTNEESSPLFREQRLGYVARSGQMREKRTNCYVLKPSKNCLVTNRFPVKNSTLRKEGRKDWPCRTRRKADKALEDERTVSKRQVRQGTRTIANTVQYSTVQYSCCESDIEHTGVERVLLYKVSNPVLKTTCCERDDIIIEITNLHYYAYVIATLAS
jgi:hypothetical protein